MANIDKMSKIAVVIVAMGLLLMAVGYMLDPFSQTVNIDNTPPKIIWLAPNPGLQSNTLDIMFNVEELSFIDLEAEEAFSRITIFTIDDVNITLPEVEIDLISQTEGQGGEYSILRVRVWDYVVGSGDHKIIVKVVDLAGNEANYEASFQTWEGTVKGDVYLYDSLGTIIPDGGYVGGVITVVFVPTEGADQIESVKLRILTEDEVALYTSNSDGSGDGANNWLDDLLDNELIGLTYIMPKASDTGNYEQEINTGQLIDGTYYAYIRIEDKTGGFATYSVLEYTSVNGNAGFNTLRPNNLFVVIVGVLVLIIGIVIYVWAKKREVKKFTYGGGYYG